MRVWGRVYDELGNPSWVAVETDQDGNNDYVYATALIQVLKLQLGESPFFGNYGIPALQSVMSQIAPDYYAAVTQQQYSQVNPAAGLLSVPFASLIITRVDVPPANIKIAPVPTYRVNLLTHQGVRHALNVPT